MTRRFHDLDPAHAKRWMRFSERMGPTDLLPAMLQFPLYAEEYALARMITIADLLRSTLDVPGSVAELGSWHGANVVYLAKLLRVYDPHSAKKTHCFESFRGLEDFSDHDGEATAFRSMFQGSPEHLREVVDLFSMQHELVIHEGDIVETLPQVLSANTGLRFSFVYLDLDLYTPTVTALRELHGRMNVGGLFVLDEYGWEDFPGETTAVEEFLAGHPDDYRAEYLRASRQPTMALRRVR